MWCYLKSDDIDKYITQYPSLAEYWENICLLYTKDAVFLPRLMYLTHPSEYLIRYTGKEAKTPTSINIKFNGTLRDQQQLAANAVLKRFDQLGYTNGILKLPPAAGKTVLTVYLAYKLKLKTCIVLDNSELVRQWVSEIIEFTNLKADDIGLIKGKIWSTDKPIVIAMVQTLLSRVKGDIRKAFSTIDSCRFGMVAYDEVHTTSSSEKFSQASLLFRTENVLGLSATPFHTGPAKVLMENTIGPLIFESNQYESTPSYYFVYYKSGLQKYQYPMSKMNFIGRRSYYNNILLKSPSYFNTIGRFSKNLQENGYTTLIVCMTVKQVEMISEVLTNMGIHNTRFHAKENELDKETAGTVIATYKYVGKGFNMKRLSALILATPLSGKKSVIQVVGRILRSNDNKKDPIVIDMIDISLSRFFIPEVNMKRNIVQNEFTGCKIIEYECET